MASDSEHTAQQQPTELTSLDARRAEGRARRGSRGVHGKGRGACTARVEKCTQRESKVCTRIGEKNVAVIMRSDEWKEEKKKEKGKDEASWEEKQN